MGWRCINTTRLCSSQILSEGKQRGHSFYSSFAYLYLYIDRSIDFHKERFQPPPPTPARYQNQDAQVKVKVTQSCPTLCDPMDHTVASLVAQRLKRLPPMRETVHGILQARIPEWVAFPFSKGSSQPRDQTHVSCIAGRFFTN